MERLYAGIDLHSNNSVVVVTDENDRVRFGKRLPNRLGVVLGALEPFGEGLRDIALESTFNWSEGCGVCGASGEYVCDPSV